MAAFVRERVGIRATGTSVTVPSDPKGRLMYYINCIHSLIPSLDIPQRLRNYSSYWSLDGNEIAALLLLAEALGPGNVDGKLIVRNDNLDSGNEFIELSHASTMLAVADSVVIGGERNRVAKIMLYSGSWLQRNYYDAIAEVRAQGYGSITPGAQYTSYSSGSSSSDCCCVLL